MSQSEPSDKPIEKEEPTRVSGRKRVPVAKYAPAVESVKKTTPVEGKGIPIGALADLADEVNASPEDLLRKIHRFLFNTPGTKKLLKVDILGFSGFVFSEEDAEEEQAEKLNYLLSRFSKDELTDMAVLFSLKSVPTDKDKLAKDLLEFLVEPKLECLGKRTKKIRAKTSVHPGDLSAKDIISACGVNDSVCETLFNSLSEEEKKLLAKIASTVNSSARKEAEPKTERLSQPKPGQSKQIDAKSAPEEEAKEEPKQESKAAAKTKKPKKKAEEQADEKPAPEAAPAPSAQGTPSKKETKKHEVAEVEDAKENKPATAPKKKAKTTKAKVPDSDDEE